jgi:hypothetical protein
VTRRFFATLLLAPIAALSAEEEALSGTLGATDQEADEGYFALGHLMLIAKPRSAEHDWLRSRLGKTVQVTSA